MKEYFAPTSQEMKEKSRLLGVENTAEKIIRYLEKNVSEYRRNHIFLTAEYAMLLSRVYFKENSKATQNAFLAALAHDITKECKTDCHYKLFKTANVAKSWYDLPERILHSKSGYIFINKKFKMDNAQIRDAIEYHTTGHPDMDTVAEIVFAADYLGSMKNRKATMEITRPLHVIALKKIQKSLLYLIKNGLPVHPDTINYYNTVIKK